MSVVSRACRGSREFLASSKRSNPAASRPAAFPATKLSGNFASACL